MPKWTDYTTKTTVADNDEVMVLDTAGKANKRLSLSTLSDWVLGKIADKVFEKLQTNDKTILGAINELNSNRLTDSTKLLETPTEYIKNISDSDYTSCFRNGKIVTLVLNVKVLKPLSAFNIYLTLPEQYAPSSVIFAPAIGLNAGIRIGLHGEVMPCVNVNADMNLQTVVSYVIK